MVALLNGLFCLHQKLESNAVDMPLLSDTRFELGVAASKLKVELLRWQLKFTKM